MLRWAKRNLKKFNKTSVWLKATIILILLLCVYHIHNQTIKEGFIQRTSRGRQALEKTFKYLNLEKPQDGDQIDIF